MKKRNVLIVLFISTFWIHASAQFSKRLTPEEQNKSKEYSSKISQNEEQLLSHFSVDESYKEELKSIIHYYESLKLIKKYKLDDSKVPTKEEWIFFQDYQKDVYKLLFLNGTYTATPNYHRAYLLRKKLNLSDKILRVLADNAVTLQMNSPNLDEHAYWEIEFKELSSILTNEQMDYLLRKKNASKSWERVNKAMNLLSKANDFYKEDSSYIKSQLYNYYYRIAIADELYKNDSVMKKEAYKGIRKFTSPIISKLEIIQRRTKKGKVNTSSNRESEFSKNSNIPNDYYIWLSADKNQRNIQTVDAVMLALGVNGRINREKAFIQLKKIATQDNPSAMNALALMYLKGYGTNTDTVAALNYWEIAGNNGCYEALNNIGFFYKTEEKNYDIRKSYLYFSKAADNGNSIGSYMAGYLLYKGIGCEQNYEKAITHFKIGANNTYAPSLYMLGLCYRNGYGVEQNEQTAKLFLGHAASQSHKEALKELELEFPENNTYLAKDYDKEYKTIFAQLSHKKVQDLTISDIENGEYIGTLATYDWSGKCVIEEVPLTLTLSKQKDIITGEWCEAGSDPIKIFAHIEGSKLIFDEQPQKPLGRYKRMKYLSSFQEADLRMAKKNKNTSLLGALKMYSSQTREKERPMYFYLTKSNEKANIQSISAFPNPFSKEFYLYLDISENSNIIITIHDVLGNLCYQHNIGVLLKGEQHITIQPNLKKGTYFINVYINGKKNELTIISK